MCQRRRPTLRTAAFGPICHGSRRIDSLAVSRPAILLSIFVFAVAVTTAPVVNAAEPSGDGRPSSEPAAAGELIIDLPSAIRLAELHAPELLEPEAELRGSSALAAAAARPLHRPPRVEVSMGPRLAPGGGRAGLDATLGVFQEISTARYGSALEGYSTAVKQRATAHRDAVRRDARVRASLAWLAALEAQALIELRKRAVTGAQEIQRIAEARAAAGRSSPGEAALAEAVVGSAEASVLAAEGALTTASAMLRQICGIDLHRELRVTGALETPPLTVDEAWLRSHVLRISPDLQAARARAHAAEQAARFGVTQSRPHLELGPSVSREGTGEWIVLGHVRMPLPGVDPAAAENAERKLSAHLAVASVGVAEQAVLRDVEVALHEREHSTKVRNLLKSKSIAAAERAAREAELQYEAGRNDLVSVIAARRELFDALEKWTVAAVDVQRAEAQIARYTAGTTGPQLTKGGMP
jgi:outer membrane protein TolC